MSKETERAALHRTIWQVVNDLRGSVDGWDFKAYTLGFLFYRFISENLTDHVNRTEREAGDPDFDYRYLAQEDAEGIRQGLVEEKGFFILPGDLFADVHERAGPDRAPIDSEPPGVHQNDIGPSGPRCAREKPHDRKGSSKRHDALGPQCHSDGQAGQAGRATCMTSRPFSAARGSISPARLSGTRPRELVRPMSHVHASSPKVSQSTGMFSGSYVPSG